jgi:hypothetical protein
VGERVAAMISSLSNIGMTPHGITSDEFAAILDHRCAKWAAIAREHAIKPVH